MNYQWNWSIFRELSPDGVHTYAQTLLAGLGWTLATSLSAWALALALGVAVAVARTWPGTGPSAAANLAGRAMRLAGGAWVELFRNVPLLVQLFLWFFVLPELLPRAAGDWLKALPNAPFVTAVVCLGCFTSARWRCRSARA